MKHKISFLLKSQNSLGQNVWPMYALVRPSDIILESKTRKRKIYRPKTLCRYETVQISFRIVETFVVT